MQRFSSLIILCLAATWVVWGSTYLAIKFALVSFPPFFQMGTRFLVAGGLLMGWVWLRGEAMPDRTQWRNAAIVGALMLGGGMGFTAVAEQTVASGLIVAFIAISPALIALANLFFRIRPSRLEVAGIAVGICGVLYLVRGAAFSASPAGLMAIVIACTSWVIGSVLSQHRFALARGASGFASEMLCGGLILMAMSLAAGEDFRWPPQPLATAAWGYLVVFGSLIAFSAYMILLARTSAALATSYAFVNPVIALLLGITLGGEIVTRHEWVAVGVVTAGVVLLVMGTTRRRSGQSAKARRGLSSA